MIRVFTAASAELLELQAIRSGLLVLRRHVIAALTIAALQYNVIAWHNLLSSDKSYMSYSPHGSHRPMGPMRPIQQLPTQFPRPPFCRLHELRSAGPSPWQSARSVRFPSARCRRASPSPRPAADALRPSRPWSESKTAAGNR